MLLLTDLNTVPDDNSIGIAYCRKMRKKYGRYPYECLKNFRFITSVRPIVHDTYKTAKINFINSGQWI